MSNTELDRPNIPELYAGLAKTLKNFRAQSNGLIFEINHHRQKTREEYIDQVKLLLSQVETAGHYSDTFSRLASLHTHLDYCSAMLDCSHVGNPNQVVMPRQFP